MEYNGVEFQKLSFLEDNYDDLFYGIPESSGIYYWVYFPDFDYVTASPDSLKKLINEFMEKSLFFEEEIKGSYKFEGIIKEQGFRKNGEIFGLSATKSLLLYDYFNDAANREFFYIFFKELCFARPFYVGKANNLRTRLAKQHFKGISSHIMSEIRKNAINGYDIWVGYKIIPDRGRSNINVIFEEIFSRVIKPGLTKKPN